MRKSGWETLIPLDIKYQHILESICTRISHGFVSGNKDWKSFAVMTL